MSSQRLGCISAWGLLAVLITSLIIAGVGLARGGVLFSPGELSQQKAAQPLGGVYSHAETGGNCSACHAAPWSRTMMADRCQECHTAIMAAGELHASLLVGTSPNCRNCHPEHRGPQAELTLFDPDHFPHETVGYSLAGHQQRGDGEPFNCHDCHIQDIRSFDPKICDVCHRQIQPDFMTSHTAAFGEGCLACHDGVDRYGPDFDHSGLAFPLTGLHADLACTDCHAGAQSPDALRAAPQDCFGCHQVDDPHQAPTFRDCQACHTTDGWSSAFFDHSQTAFPLTGGHVRLKCQECHEQQVFKGTPSDCFSCHSKDDAHQGEFGPDCSACHTTESWQEVVFDHSLSVFPLTGAHVQVACDQCHLQGAGGTIFRGTPQECQACHADPDYHSGLFRPDCAACHTDQAWSPASYDGPHTFPVDHGEVGMSQCRVCHPDRLQSYTCYGCHEHDPVQIENKHREEGINDFNDCTRCHPTGREEEGEHGGEGDDD